MLAAIQPAELVRHIRTPLHLRGGEVRGRGQRRFQVGRRLIVIDDGVVDLLRNTGGHLSELKRQCVSARARVCIALGATSGSLHTPRPALQAGRQAAAAQVAACSRGAGAINLQRCAAAGYILKT
eukprot:SAG31_NODE_1394_length_8528_cov_24.396251_1_plen_125_part_00